MKAAETVEKFAGFAIRCAADGEILEIVRDQFGGLQVPVEGKSFFELVDRDSRDKADSFFKILHTQKAAFGWELNVPHPSGKIESLHFAGALAEKKDDSLDETYLIVAAQSRNAVSRFYNELTRINNEQTNSLRAALKDLSLQMREQAERDNHFYNELSRLNNELTTAQRELARKNAELARLNAQKNQFLGIASHDLRNPLGVILQYSEFLLEDTKDILGSEQIEYIHKIYSSSEFMLNLVNDFLDYSKIESGRFDLERKHFDLHELIRKSVELHQLPANKKCIKIILKSSIDSIKIYADESKIEQVLSNFLCNAIKFSPVDSVIKINLDKQDECAVISVQDNGAGIAKSELSTLFSPFVSGKTKPTHGEKSTGLGLAIVKKIVEAHGGKVEVESDIGKGTTFFVSLPL